MISDCPHRPKSPKAACRIESNAPAQPTKMQHLGIKKNAIKTMLSVSLDLVTSASTVRSTLLIHPRGLAHYKRFPFFINIYRPKGTSSGFLKSINNK